MGVDVPVLLIDPLRLQSMGIEFKMILLSCGFRFLLRHSLFFLRFDDPCLGTSMHSTRDQCIFLHTVITPLQALTSFVCSESTMTRSGSSMKPFNRINKSLSGGATEIETLFMHWYTTQLHV
jgi:hypothetical protein